MKSLYLLLLGALTINVASAETLAEEQLQAIQTVKNYADAIACHVSVSKEPILLEHYFIDDEKKIEFLIPWHGDVGCIGSERAEGTELAFLYYDNFKEGYLLIDFYEIMNLYDENNGIDGRFIDSVSLNDKEQIEILAGTTDNGEYPNKFYKYIITRSGSYYGNFVVANIEKILQSEYVE